MVAVKLVHHLIDGDGVRSHALNYKTPLEKHR